jgi:hypothetical protein
MMMCIPSVPQAVMATSNRNGARARRLSGEVFGNRIVYSDVRLQHAYMGRLRQQRQPPGAGGA